MLKYFYGTNLEELVEKFAEERLANPPVNPLEKETFIVQNHGIGQWLSLYIARKEGIAANMEFKFPSEILWKLIRNLDSDIPETLPSDRQPMAASLMQILSEEKVLSDFSQLKYYIEAEEGGTDEMRLWQLSTHIADVFDQYLIYRPEMILGWEQNSPEYVYGTDSEKWQARLWKRLLKHWKETYDGEWLHRAELQKALFEKLENNVFSFDDFPEKLTVFGVSMMPPGVIRALTVLGENMNVDFYRLSVDPEKKDSEHFRNPLLQSLGKESVDFESLFDLYTNVDKKRIHEMDHQTDTLFSCVQSDLMLDKPAAELKTENREKDSSIQVHSCHSPMREVEVLYDQLLKAFDEHPQLAPDDVLIMTTDIETYAPFIEAVLEAPDEGQPRIPFGIADRNIKGENPVIESFIDILRICESRFKVTEVLDLLNSPAVQDKYELTDDDLNRIERWIRENNVRWGIDGAFKKEMDLPQSSRFTWKAALERIILGYSMNPDDDRLYEDLFPYDEIETSDDARLAGKLSRFLRALFDIAERIETDRKVEDWIALLKEITNTFLFDEGDYYREISYIRQSLEKLNQWSKLANWENEIPFSVIRMWVGSQLDERKSGGGRLGRGVTFSSLKPMRSIPFKFIGMLGMNEGAFPRSKIPAEFDLIHQNPQPGDPIRSQEDRNQFLETLLSAGDTIYFSYLGQSNQQDADFPPSVVLTEFCDYLEEYYGINRNNLIHKHRLQAFSHKYFREGNPESYSREKMEIAETLQNNQPENPRFTERKLPEPDEEKKHISIRDLVSFYQNPSEYMLRNRLDIYLRDDDVLTEDREPFQLGWLEEYQIKQELLKRFLEEQPLESYENILKARDMLPEGWSGKEDYRQKREEVEEFGTQIQELLDGEKLTDQEVAIDIGEFRITGRMENIYPQARMDYRFGTAREKDKVEWWINHLIFQYVKPEEHPGKSMLLSWKYNKLRQHSLEAVEDAEKQLHTLLKHYWEGLQSPLPFLSKSSFAYAESFIESSKDHEDALDDAIKQWEPTDYPGYYSPGERDNSYIALIYDGHNPLSGSDFSDLAIEFWKPFFEHLGD